jgi:DNA-binding LacI/PurR family transcriptional regulator
MRGMALRTGLTYQVAVLMPVSAVSGFEWDGVEYTQILSGISKGLEGSPYQIAVHVVRNLAEGLAVARRIVEQKLADGLIFSGILAQDGRVDYLVAQDFPFVALGRCRSNLDYAYVDIDNHWAAHAATARLIAGGHRRIALINPDPALSYALDRIDGFSRAFAEAGLPGCTDLIRSGDLTARHGKSAVQQLRSAFQPPTGFVCVNESDVIAYDDINASAYFAPPLTTFYQPIEHLGEKLGAFLLRRLGGEPPDRLKELTRPELVIRQPNRLEG